MRRNRDHDSPMMRTGHCCGEKCPMKGLDTTLYRVNDSRYRCVRCYARETGHMPMVP